MAPVEVIKSKWFEALQDQAFRKVCRSCTLFFSRLDQDSGKNTTMSGYKCDADGLFFQIARRRKRKKPVHLRIIAEMKRLGRRVKNKLSK